MFGSRPSIISWLLHLCSFPIPRRVVWASEQDTQPGKPLTRKYLQQSISTSFDPLYMFWLRMLPKHTSLWVTCWMLLSHEFIGGAKISSLKASRWCSQASTLCVDTATIAARRQSPSPGDFEELLNSLGPSILTHRCGQFGYATSIEQSKDLIYNRFIMKNQIWYLYNISSYLQQGMIRKSPILCDTRAQWLPMKFKRKIQDFIRDFTNLQKSQIT